MRAGFYLRLRSYSYLDTMYLRYMTCTKASTLFNKNRQNDAVFKREHIERLANGHVIKKDKTCFLLKKSTHRRFVNGHVIKTDRSLCFLCNKKDNIQTRVSFKTKAFLSFGSLTRLMEPLQFSSRFSVNRVQCTQNRTTSRTSRAVCRSAFTGTTNSASLSSKSTSTVWFQTCFRFFSIWLAFTYLVLCVMSVLS